MINIKFNSSNKNLIIASIAGIDSREKADTLKNKKLYITNSQLKKITTEDTFYSINLIGLNIIDQDHTIIGKVIDVTDHGAGDNLIIE